MNMGWAPPAASGFPDRAGIVHPRTCRAIPEVMRRPWRADNPAMAFFTKDRDRERRAGPSAPPPIPVVEAPREADMVDRDHGTTRGTDGAALTAFLGKGTRITGTLVFEGPCRIEGHVEGEI